MGVTLPSDLGSFQDTGVAQLNQNLLSVKLVGLAIVVGFDAAHKVRLSRHHFGQQVHQRILEQNMKEFKATLREKMLIKGGFNISLEFSK